jgi:hypothetical protein
MPDGAWQGHVFRTHQLALRDCDINPLKHAAANEWAVAWRNTHAMTAYEY